MCWLYMYRYFGVDAGDRIYDGRIAAKQLSREFVASAAEVGRGRGLNRAEKGGTYAKGGGGA